MTGEEWEKIEKQTSDEFSSRMDRDYFASFSSSEVSTHIRMAARLAAGEPLQAEILPLPGTDGAFRIVIVAFDYLSEFSVLCGLISAFGLDIQSGDIHSFGNAVSGTRNRQRKIVDVFRVRPNSNASFGETQQQAFIDTIQRFARLLATGDIQEPREQLNRFLVESIERMEEPLTGLRSPIEIRFDNDASPDWTLLETRSKDAFAFLYAVSNALAMRAVYIHQAKIRSSDNDVSDRFLLADRWGRKIESVQEQERLKVGIAMIKEFTSFLPEAPDPAKAMRHFDRFIDRLAEAGFSDHVVAFLAQTRGMNVLAHLLGSSDYLWDDFLGTHFHDLVPVLEDLEHLPLEPDLSKLQHALNRAGSLEQKKSALNRFKEAELFRIDAKHLLEPAVTLLEFSLALTDLAEGVLNEAARICYKEIGGDPGRYAICALGKFGGREMGCASDLELVFVHEPETATPAFELFARRITEIIETRKTGIFHIDLRLRPYGDAGLWSIPFAEFANYYSAAGDAAPFERQALTKLRFVAGNEELGRRIEAHRDSFTYSGEPCDSENALHLRRRQMKELVRPGEVNMKYSAGGIVDVEYAVQYLQLLHGHRHSELRVTSTLDALQRLCELKILGDREHAELHGAYIFLRNVIDALRIVHGDASDLVLPPQDSEDFKSLARRLGYRTKDRAKNAAALASDLNRQMQLVHEQFLARYDT